VYKNNCVWEQTIDIDNIEFVIFIPFEGRMNNFTVPTCSRK
jgi:hypothetical protein